MTAPWVQAAAADPSWPAAEGPVAAAVDAARSALARLNGPRGVRDRTGRVAAAAAMRAARASAALEGVPLALDPQDVAITDLVLAGAVRVAAGLGGLSGTWRRAPRQVLAWLHTLAAADLVAEPELAPAGRPGPARPGQRPAGGPVGSGGASTWPAPVLVAIVHGELATLALFGSPTPSSPGRRPG
ncbi:MAG: hypothetical protein U0R72_06170 [Nakamurella multipartita]